MAELNSSRGERLSAEDEFNFLLDRGDSVYVLMVAGTLASGGFVSADGTYDIAALRRTLVPRIRGIPRLTLTPVREWGRHRLVDRGFDVDQHIRSLSPVSGVDEFRQLCTRLCTTRLPADRPLWELLLVPQTAERQPGWIFRIHHALADAATAAHILQQLFDPLPPADEPSSRAPTHYAPPQAGTVVVKGRSRTRSAFAYRLPPSALLGTLGRGREARFIDLPLDAVSHAAHRAGATINDLLLAAVGEGALAAFETLGAPTPGFWPVAIPVLLPDEQDETNRVSVAVVGVPLGEMGLSARARAVSEVSASAIAQTRARPLPGFVRIRTGARIVRWYITRQRRVALNCTNFRGPAQVQRIGGAPIDSVRALPVLSGNLRFGVAAVSYAGTLSIAALWSDRLGAAGEAFADRIATSLTDAPA